MIPRVRDTDNYKELTFPELADGLVEVDTAGWAESWEQLSGRILAGFTAIAQEVEGAGGGNALVVSHSMTIGTFAYLIDKAISKNPEVDNGSVTVVEYGKGQFTIQILGDVSYREVGAKILDSEINS